jgi:cytochrome c
MKRMVAWTIMIAAVVAASNAWAQSGDAARGEGVFNQQCKACHTTEKGAPNKVGPNLFGVVGRKAATLDGFSYSSAMQKSGLTWDEKTLSDYLKEPRKIVPGTKMAFVGLRKQDQIDDVIAYLKKAAP